MDNILQNKFDNPTQVNDETKAKIFTFNSKVFIRSLSDAITCTNQIAAINCSKDLYLSKTSILDKTMKRKSLLLAKYCDHDICNTNIIASDNLNSYYTYFMMKFSVNLYLNFYERLKECNDYYKLSKELDNINEMLISDLKSYVGFTKKKHFILTKDVV